VTAAQNGSGAERDVGDAGYATLGFNEAAALDEGAIWPTTFAIREIAPEVERTIVELLKRAGG
jgi:hypothetical protein